MNLKESLEKAYKNGKKLSTSEKASAFTDLYVLTAIFRKLMSCAYDSATSGKKTFTLKADTTIVVSEPRFVKNINFQMSKEDIDSACEQLGFRVVSSFEENGQPFYEIEFLT